MTKGTAKVIHGEKKIPYRPILLKPFLIMITANRYHDFCAGHRVVGHENKCKHLHGHNYRVHFFVEPLLSSGHPDTGLDEIGRVVDFSVINTTMCKWLEDNWDHRMLLWEEDPLWHIVNYDKIGCVPVPFNPTAENMAEYLVAVVAPPLLKPFGVRLRKVVIEETRKCSVTFEL